MFQAPEGRRRTRAALVRLLPAELTPTPFALTDLFARELDEYAELIVGPGGRPVGFMTRGEDRAFSERVRVALEHLGMPAAALAHQEVLARWFEHRRAFMKVEWHAKDDTTVEPLAACYFRRRPTLDDTLVRLQAWGVAAGPRKLAAEVASALDKRTVHFVAAAFRPEHPVVHKLYFSQLVGPDTRAQVAARIARVFALFGAPGKLREHWQILHEHCLLPGESTLFVSVSFSGDRSVPSFKIDYPGVSPARAAAWLPAAAQGEVLDDAGLACALAETRTLSYLGVRFRADEPAPALKYYCDVPSPP